MRKLKTHRHPGIENLNLKSVFTRLSSRAICIHKNEILLVYTKRYDDFGLPGGGLEASEDKVAGMKRELNEETGAMNVKNIQEFGVYEEFRPWHKEDFDIQHILSYCYTCDIDYKLSESSYEDYEIKNGMSAQWVGIKQALDHNKKTIRSNDNKGLSVYRETFLLELIHDELFKS